ncbi:hypothetical protein ACGFYM_38505 [Streptomyces sp. NPDC048231]|uniref:RipA family octameric membrane protein n=1 Tax=Streptomyces sp. NPDC048231 TaxID=3365519 RepID=UPI0037109A1A
MLNTAVSSDRRPPHSTTTQKGMSQPVTAEHPLPDAEAAEIPDPRILDLYKTAVEMSDRISARRGTANAFYLTVQTALVSVLGLSPTRLASAPWWMNFAVCLAGLTLSTSWWLQLRSYRSLNRAKFTVIHAMEMRLPVKIFTVEWEALRQDRTQPHLSRYVELGMVERAVPLVFAAIHLLVFVGPVS